jgi:hypothetical protein
MISENLEAGWLAQPPLSSIRPDRNETSLLGAHVPKSVHRLIRLLAVEESTTVSALLCDAVALIIGKYGRATPPALEHDLANRKDGRRCKHGHAAAGALERFESGEVVAGDFLGHAARVKFGIEKKRGYPDLNAIEDYASGSAGVVHLRSEGEP